MSNPFAWSFRLQFALGALICFGLVGFALYVQHQLFVEPCPLCVLQRICFITLGLLFLAGAVHGPRGALGRRIYGSLAALPALVGAGIAGWHVRLQHLPADQVPSCGPGLEYMLQAFPLKQALVKVFAGSGECAEVDWTFAGLSMPAWTLLWFIGLALLALFAGWRRREP
jgi:protein dithiol:quinone oxidoreductase